MSDIDYSKYSNEELEAIANSGQPKATAQPGLISQALHGYGNYAKGFAKGGGQALGDIGASIINWPISGLEHLSGKKLPHVPHPHLTEGNPGSLMESIGQKVGGLLPMVVPGAAGARTARLVGQGAPAIAKLLAGGASGALTGAASSEGHRGQGALLGGLLGAVGAGYPMSPHLTKRGASKRLREAHGLAQERDIGALNVPHELIEDTRQFLPQTTPYKNMLERAENREYPELFNLQSDVGRHAHDYTRSWFSAAERAHGREGLAARDRLLEAIREDLRNKGHHDIAELMQKGQNDYRRYMKIKPYKNMAIGLGAASLIPDNPITNIVKKLLLHSK